MQTPKAFKANSHSITELISNGNDNVLNTVFNPLLHRSSVNISMAFHRAPKPKPKSTRSPILLLVAAVTAIALLFLFSSLLSTAGTKPSLFQRRQQHFEKYLYWGNRIDCPGKHCGSCEGLGHQESSLRCALEEAIFLGRTFVLPSRMCINPIHNKKGILHHSANGSSEELWDASSCAMDSLYDTELMSGTVPVIFDNSKEWYRVLSTIMKLGTRGVEHVEGVSRFDLKENSHYSDMLLINRTASPLSWFMECKDRNNRSSILLPYSFLPSPSRHYRIGGVTPFSSHRKGHRSPSSPLLALPIATDRTSPRAKPSPSRTRSGVVAGHGNRNPYAFFSSHDPKAKGYRPHFGDANGHQRPRFYASLCLAKNIPEDVSRYRKLLVITAMVAGIFSADRGDHE